MNVLVARIVALERRVGVLDGLNNVEVDSTLPVTHAVNLQMRINNLEVRTGSLESHSNASVARKSSDNDYEIIKKTSRITNLTRERNDYRKDCIKLNRKVNTLTRKVSDIIMLFNLKHFF